MRQFFVLSIGLLTIMPAAAPAQIRRPVFESNGRVENASFEEARNLNDLRHGSLVRITRNDRAQSQVRGTLVRIDAGRGILYVRTRPGAAPRPIAESDIKRLDRGVITEVGLRSDVSTPEIHELTIYNGSERTVSFDAPALSTEELTVLNEVESAANTLARLERDQRIQEQVLENDLAIQTAMRRAREQVARGISPALMIPQAPETFRATAFGYPERVAVPEMTPQNLSELLLAAMSPVPFLRLGPSVFPRIPVESGTMAQARRNYRTALSHAVLENGRIVAVIVNGSADKSLSGSSSSPNPQP